MFEFRHLTALAAREVVGRQRPVLGLLESECRTDDGFWLVVSSLPVHEVALRLPEAVFGEKRVSLELVELVERRLDGRCGGQMSERQAQDANEPGNVRQRGPGPTGSELPPRGRMLDPV